MEKSSWKQAVHDEEYSFEIDLVLSLLRCIVYNLVVKARRLTVFLLPLQSVDCSLFLVIASLTSCLFAIDKEEEEVDECRYRRNSRKKVRGSEEDTPQSVRTAVSRGSSGSSITDRSPYCRGSPESTTMVNTRTKTGSTNAKLQASNEELQAQLKDAREQLKKTKAENKRLSSAKVGPNKRAKRGNITEAQQIAATELGKKIKEDVNLKLFRMVKFVSDDEDQAVATRMLAGIMDTAEFREGTEDQIEGNIVKFIENYGKFVTGCLNERRNYVQSQAKSVAFEYMKENEGTLPTLEELLKVVSRNAEEADDDLAVWWFDEFLPLCMGHKDIWDESVRYFTTVTRACTEEPYIEKSVTVQSEALAILYFHNYSESWKELYRLGCEHPHKHIKVCAKKPAVPRKSGGKYVYVYKPDNPKLVPKWSRSDNGQNQYKGWSTKGLEKYKKYRKLVKKARVLPTTEEYERKILGLMREKHQIEANSHDEHKKSLGFTAKKPAAAVNQGVKNLIYSSDEEEDDRKPSAKTDDEEEADDSDDEHDIQ